MVDPWAGSYMMEKLTQDMADKAWAIIEEVETIGGMTKAVQSGWAKLRIEACAAEKQACIDRGDDVIVGVNKYTLRRRTRSGFARSTTPRCARRRSSASAEVRAKRDRKAVEAALAAIAAAAKGGEDLLALSIDAMRARATVGEVSDALESVWGRYKAHAETVSGVYGAAFAQDAEWQALKAEVEAFESEEGRRPRIMIAKVGQDGHDRGAKVVATAFADLGFDVDVGPLFQTPEEAARQAIENDVHAIGVSTLAAGHKTLVPQIIKALRDQGAPEIVVVVGGVVPQQDYAFLEKAGVAAVFGPGTVISTAARALLASIRKARMVAGAARI